jgi:F-type H+-transporting ATPase subunit delta
MPDSHDLNAEHARTAAQIGADVGVEHIASVYAKGLIDAAEKSGETAAVLAEYDALMTGVLDRFPRFEAVLDSLLISPEEKAALLDRVFGGRASSTFIHFLKVVARHERLDCLRAIHRQARALDDQLRNRVAVRLTTATPLDAAATHRMAESIRAALGGEPVFQQTTDPALIGGAVLQIGDTVYDGSVANQLQNLRERISDRSAHEIQSRRDRFRNPAGN